jgi:serine/threonine-protein kinase PknG
LAEQLYLVCARTDGAYTAPAAFGLARVRESRGDLDGAIAALDLVPATSSSFVAARRRRAGLFIQGDGGLPALANALDSIESVAVDRRERARLAIDVLASALRIVKQSGPDRSVSLGGIPADDRSLRDGLERAYRELADQIDDRDERIELVDAANRVRRWTWR